jgi:hypothetical protein
MEKGQASRLPEQLDQQSWQWQAGQKVLNLRRPSGLLALTVGSATIRLATQWQTGQPAGMELKEAEFQGCWPEQLVGLALRQPGLAEKGSKLSRPVGSKPRSQISHGKPHKQTFVLTVTLASESFHPAVAITCGVPTVTII